MNSNELLIAGFYQAFQNKDYATMQNTYADIAVFNDAVFKNLNAIQVRAMWEMLIKNGKDLKLSFDNIKAEAGTVTAEWTAVYTFSRTKRKVTNHIKAAFIIENGKIVKHTDHFNFYKWAAQALGLTGYLLGYTSFIKQKIQQTALKNLNEFMKKEFTSD